MGNTFYNGLIYICTNKINNKSYIGRTIQLFEERKIQHLRNYKKNNTYFYSALRKYGVDNFEWSILFRKKCTISELNNLERFFIGYYGTYNNGYNLTLGGDGSDGLFWKGRKHSDESKKKMSKAKKKLIAEGWKPYGDKETKRKIQKKVTRIRKENGSYITGGKKISEIKRNWSEEKKKEVSKKLSYVANKYYLKGLHVKHVYLLTFPDGTKISINKGLRYICDKYNLSFPRIYSYVNKGEIPKIKGNSRNVEKSNRCEGMSIIKSNKMPMKEMAMFYQQATRKEITNMEKIIKSEDWNGFKKMIEKVLNVKLH